MATVHLKNVAKKYQDRSASKRTRSEESEDGTWGVRGVSLDIADQEFLVLVGPSGCGKSTTLRMIAGLESCTEGSIWIDGEDVSDVPPSRRNIAMVFQNYALYPHMTVYNNIGFGLFLKNGGLLSGLRRWLGREEATGLTRQEIDRRIRQTADKLSIKHLLEKRPHQLSGGERQRVALGRAIARNPAAFLFDEPLSNLDAKLRGQMRAELKRLHRDLKATMIYVTHDQIEAMTLGDRIAVMNGGQLQQVGSPEEIYNQPANEFVARFIGNNPINLFDGKLEQQNDQSIFVGDHFKLELNRVNNSNHSLSVKLGIRPEHIQITNGDLKENRVECSVTQIDSLGDSTLIHAEIGQERILTRTTEDRSFNVGDVIRLSLDKTKIHLFDRGSGKRLES